jgi:hypothetical protein
MTATFFFGEKQKFLTTWYYSDCLHCQLMKGLRYKKSLFFKVWFTTLDYLCSVILLRLVSSILCSNCCVVILQIWIYNLLNFSLDECQNFVCPIHRHLIKIDWALGSTACPGCRKIVLSVANASILAPHIVPKQNNHGIAFYLFWT